VVGSTTGCAKGMHHGAVAVVLGARQKRNASS
jgi:hypothetical protein